MKNTETPKVSSKDKQQLAESLYLYSKLNRKQIADQVGTTEKTLRDWIEKFGWETMKQSLSITRTELLQTEYRILSAINNEIFENLKGIPNKQLSDARAVSIKAIEALTEKLPIHVFVETFEQMIPFIQNNYPEFILPFTQITSDFLSHFSKK